MSNSESVIHTRFDAACRIYLSPIITRYLLVHQEGRWDGVEKAIRHSELCKFYVAVYRGQMDPEAIQETDALYCEVHDATQSLTDHLDEAIGFPLVGRPDYDRLVPLFFEQFHVLALAALGS
jgi:hypothetical protein